MSLISFSFLSLFLIGFWSQCHVSSFSIRKEDTIRKQKEKTAPLFFDSVYSDAERQPTLWETKEMTIALPLQKKHTRKNNRRLLFRKNKNSDELTFQYNYFYDQLLLTNASPKNNHNQNNNATNTIGVILVHPIGIGIGKWYHHRLLSSLASIPAAVNLHIISPDLLGSASASTNILPNNSTTIQPPLWNISDWAFQLNHLMCQVETSTNNDIDSWAVVANGGCSPIALQLLQQSISANNPSSSSSSANSTTVFYHKPISHVILSSTPRLPFFLPSSINPKKVQKSYQRLCSILGKAFWWYALRNNGAFIQKFSERNLVATPSNLGPHWTRNCVKTATDNKDSRYSTFAFLAGALQDGCQSSIETILSSAKNYSKSKNLTTIGFLYGRDRRRNKARSWFWQKRKLPPQNSTKTTFTKQSLRDYLKTNGYPISLLPECSVGGRVSLAHEDSEGYSHALLNIVSSDKTDITTYNYSGVKEG